MQLSTFISMLEALQHGGRVHYGEGWDPEVLIVHQQSYPLQEVVTNAVVEYMRPSPEDDPDGYIGSPEYDVDANMVEQPPEVMYVVASGHPHDRSPYGPSWPFEINQEF